jgi:hypothetical protein
MKMESHIDGGLLHQGSKECFGGSKNLFGVFVRVEIRRKEATKSGVVGIEELGQCKDQSGW